MVKKLVAVFPLMVLMVLLSGCVVQSAPAAAGGNNVVMGASTYTSGDKITIKKGQSITFSDDKSTGTEHILVIGTNGQPASETGAPDLGTNGMTFHPGDSQSIGPWMTAGTFHVTCVVHPTTMNLTVTVTA